MGLWHRKLLFYSDVLVWLREGERPVACCMEMGGEDGKQDW